MALLIVSAAVLLTSVAGLLATWPAIVPTGNYPSSLLTCRLQISIGTRRP
jgi:hypothetical protein